MEVTVKGRGIFPMLAFDTKEVVMPVVPLGITSTSMFAVVSEGFENLELRYRLPSDTDKVPLTLRFPEGQVVSRVKKSVPVEVSFTTSKPISFTAKIDFFDLDGNRFSIPVSGTSDNCILTNYPFLSSSKKTHRLWCNGTDDPIMLEERKQMEVGFVPILIVGGHLICFSVMFDPLQQDEEEETFSSRASMHSFGGSEGASSVYAQSERQRCVPKCHIGLCVLVTFDYFVVQASRFLEEYTESPQELAECMRHADAN